MGLIDLVFPKRCLECKKEGFYICPECIRKVSFSKLVCPCCQRWSFDGNTHVRCQGKTSLDGLVSIWNYEGVIRKAIISLKYKYTKEIIPEISNYLIFEIKRRNVIFKKDALLVPVPSYWYRENFRGFNQAKEIGKIVASKMEWKFAPNILLRKKGRAPQTELKKQERSKNIKGVFSLNIRQKSAISTQESLILFDDVWTTGSTLKEGANVLKSSGVKKIWGLTVCS